MSTSARLFEYIDVNPKERLAKGTLAKKISMDKLQPFCRVHVALVLEFKRLEDVDSGELDIRDGISFVNAHGSKIDTLLSSRLWLLLCKAFQASERKKHDEYYYVKPCVHVAKVHHSV